MCLVHLGRQLTRLHPDHNNFSIGQSCVFDAFVCASLRTLCLPPGPFFSLRPFAPDLCMAASALDDEHRLPVRSACPWTAVVPTLHEVQYIKASTPSPRQQAIYLSQTLSTIVHEGGRRRAITITFAALVCRLTALTNMRPLRMPRRVCLVRSISGQNMPGAQALASC